MKAELDGTKLSFLNETGLHSDVHSTLRASRYSILMSILHIVFSTHLSADCGLEQRLRNLSAHASTLEHQLEQEVRQAEVTIPSPVPPLMMSKAC